MYSIPVTLQEDSEEEVKSFELKEGWGIIGVCDKEPL